MAWVLQCPSMSSEIAAPFDCCHVLVPAFLAPLRGSFYRLSALIILGQGTPCREASLSPLPSSTAPTAEAARTCPCPALPAPSSWFLQFLHLPGDLSGLLLRTRSSVCVPRAIGGDRMPPHCHCPVSGPVSFLLPELLSSAGGMALKC